MFVVLWWKALRFSTLRYCNNIAVNVSLARFAAFVRLLRWVQNRFATQALANVCIAMHKSAQALRLSTGVRNR